MSFDPSHSGLTRDTIIPNTDYDQAKISLSPELKESFLRELVPELNYENNRLKKENRILREINSNKDLEIFDLKQQIKDLKSQLADKPESINQSQFDYSINRRLWMSKDKDVVPTKSVIKLSDLLLELVEYKDGNGDYLIKCEKEIAPIYIILSQDSNLAYNYTGNRPDFEYFWNDNVVERIQDPIRKKKLTCHETTLKATMNKNPWAGISITSWRGLMSEGINSNEYKLGVILKEKIEAFKL